VVALADTTPPAVQAYLRHRTGLSATVTGKTWHQRLLGYRWTWAGLGLIIFGAVSITVLIRDIMTPIMMQDGSKVPGLNSDALWLSAGRALPTMAFWIVCFLLVDRYKPQRLLVWALALGWGATVAVTGSYYVNTWIGDQMAVIDQQSGVAAIRVAVFVAPFVEEAMKASVIFLIVALDRHRFTSRVSGAVVGGLAGAGFAFSENIIYYARVVVYGSYTSGAGDVMAYLDNMVLWRGFYTCFGHPMFTLCTGLGIGFAATSRSKIVRVVAPATGYLMGAFLHMFFNWWVSVLPEPALLQILFIGVWPIVILVGIRLASSAMRQGRMIGNRLMDYVTMGWLPANYPYALSRLRSRAWTILMSPWHGNVIKTWLLQVRATELATLRDAITRGTVDCGGLWREYELIDQIAELSRDGGLADGQGLRPYWPWNVGSRRRAAQPGPMPPVHPIARQNAQQAPLLKYSVVDSRWGPPA